MSLMVAEQRQPYHFQVILLRHLPRRGPRITHRWQQQRDSHSTAHKDHKNRSDHQADNQNG